MAAGTKLRVLILSARRGRAGLVILRLLQRAPTQRGKEHDRAADEGLAMIRQVWSLLLPRIYLATAPRVATPVGSA